MGGRTLGYADVESLVALLTLLFIPARACPVCINGHMTSTVPELSCDQCLRQFCVSVRQGKVLIADTEKILCFTLAAHKDGLSGCNCAV